MIDLYLVPATDLYEQIKTLSLRYIAAPTEILRTENGKPYLEGDPLFFSLSHSGERAVIVFCDNPVGVDLELDRARNYSHVLFRFSERERQEIFTRRDFYLHWTAREAFLKMKGWTLAGYIKRLEYCDGKIFVDGTEQNCKITRHFFDFGVACVCTET